MDDLQKLYETYGGTDILKEEIDAAYRTINSVEDRVLRSDLDVGEFLDGFLVLLEVRQDREDMPRLENQLELYLLSAPLLGPTFRWPQAMNHLAFQADSLFADYEQDPEEETPLQDLFMKALDLGNLWIAGYELSNERRILTSPLNMTGAYIKIDPETGANKANPFQSETAVHGAIEQASRGPEYRA